MTIATLYILAAFGVATIIGIVVIIRESRKRRLYGRTPRGTAPGEGDMILHGNERTAFMGDGLEDASRGYRVTRDPQRYAQAFVPHHKNRKGS